MSRINVMIFPAEGNNAIELHSALSACVNINLFGATSVKRHGRFIYEHLVEDLPQISDNNFLDVFNSVITQHQIDVIFPTHDTVALFLVSNQSKLSARVISGDLKTVEICRSKIKTYKLFKGEQFMPKHISGTGSSITFPLFAKPDVGEGGRGAHIIYNEDDLRKLSREDYLITEYLPGKEYTIDCLTDKDGVLRYVSPRTRERTSAGVTVAGKTVELTKEISYMADKINAALKFCGLWYFQIKEDKNGKLKLMEVSSRCSGTMVHTRSKGINLPLLSVYTTLGYDITVYDNGYNVEMDRALFGRYFINYEYNTVYIDFDDTITLRGKVNLNVIRFLYQCKNFNKRVILLTRHSDDLSETLAKYHICSTLFDEIVHIIDQSKKSFFIEEEKAIFIDNSYKERTDVRLTHHIPVFDVDQIEFLLDWHV